MGYAEVIREGFRVIHRIWQLLLVQLGMVVLSGIGFFVLVGIPLAIAFVLFSIDLTGIAEIGDILRLLKEPSDIISKYFGLVLIVIGGLLMYIVLAATFSIYVFGGSVGVIGKALGDKTMKFSMHTFFSEARRLFLPMLGFIIVVIIMWIATAFILGILGGGIAALVSFAKTYDSVLSLFLRIFFSFILLCGGLVLINTNISLFIYGAAAIVLKDIGGPKSLKDVLYFLRKYFVVCLLLVLSLLLLSLLLLFRFDVFWFAAAFWFLLFLSFIVFFLIEIGAARPIKIAAHYLYDHPPAVWLYIIVSVGYILVSFLLILLGYPFNLIPVVGTILSIPYQIISSAFQTYIGLSIIAALFAYYHSTEILTEPVVETPAPQTPPQDETPQPQSGNDLT